MLVLGIERRKLHNLKAGEGKMIIKTNISGIGDPMVLLEDDKYYMYCTSSDDGFKVFTADSLDGEWIDCGLCYFKQNGWGTKNFWAPEVIKYGKGYYMHYTAHDPKSDMLKIGLAFSASPKGPFVDVTDGPFYNPDYAVIDSHIFIDDGIAYLYYSKDCSTNKINGVNTSQIWAILLKPDLSGTMGEPVLCLTPDEKWELKESDEWQWNEGPCIIKARGKYFMNYSVNCFNSRSYSVGAAESDHPLGPWIKYKDKPILKYIENEISGPGHNSFFYDKEDKLMTAFHIHTNYDAPSGDRRACFAPVSFVDGKIKIDYK